MNSEWIRDYLNNEKSEEKASKDRLMYSLKPNINIV